MKLLLDENLSRRIVPLLEPYFPGSTQVALVGLERASDLDIWRFARDNGFCIVTRDADFYDLTLIHGIPPKVVWLRGNNPTKTAVANILIDNRDRILDMLASEEVTCVELY